MTLLKRFLIGAITLGTFFVCLSVAVFFLIWIGESLGIFFLIFIGICLTGGVAWMLTPDDSGG